VEHCYYALTGGIAKRMFGTPWILHEHNIEYLRFRELKRWWWPLLRMLESWACRNASLVLFKTESDRRHAIEHFSMKPEQSIVVPFGIARDGRPTKEEKEKSALEIRQRHGIAEDTPIIFFSGTLDYEPNARAFRSIVKNIIPVLEDEIHEPFVVLVCGRLRDPAYLTLHTLHHTRLQFVGEVEDVQPYFLAADVFINPVDTGGGIKVKTMEALSFDLPVVSTTHSAIGIDRTLTGSKLRVSPEGDIPTFCRLVAEALTDKSHIPDAYFVHYQWRHLTNKVAEAIKKLTI
jgi:glycosyltransferase involved in cell wall biosynthesis